MQVVLNMVRRLAKRLIAPQVTILDEAEILSRHLDQLDRELGEGWDWRAALASCHGELKSGRLDWKLLHAVFGDTLMQLSLDRAIIDEQVHFLDQYSDSNSCEHCMKVIGSTDSARSVRDLASAFSEATLRQALKSFIELWGSYETCYGRYALKDGESNAAARHVDRILTSLNSRDAEYALFMYRYELSTYDVDSLVSIVVRDSDTSRFICERRNYGFFPHITEAQWHSLQMSAYPETN